MDWIIRFKNKESELKSELFRFRIKSKSGKHDKYAKFTVDDNGNGRRKISHFWGSAVETEVAYISVQHFFDECVLDVPIKELDVNLTLRQVCGEVMYGILLEWKDQLYLGPTVVLKGMREKKFQWQKNGLREKDFHALNRCEHDGKYPKFSQISSDCPMKIGFSTINSTTSKQSTTVSCLDKFSVSAFAHIEILQRKLHRITKDGNKKNQTCDASCQIDIPDASTEQLMQEKRVLLNKLEIVEDKLAASEKEYLTSIEKLKDDLLQLEKKSEHELPLVLEEEYWDDQHKEMTDVLGDWNLI